MERVKGFSREAKPSAMEAVHPVVGKAECAKPDQEYLIVEGETVKQKLFDCIGIHGGSSRFPGRTGYLPRLKLFKRINLASHPKMPRPVYKPKPT